MYESILKPFLQFSLLHFFIYFLKIVLFLFIFDYAGSSLLWAFPGCREQVLLSSCSAHASHCGGFSCYNSQGPRAQAQQLGAWAWLPHGIWNIPRSALKPMHWQVNSLPLSYQRSPDLLHLFPKECLFSLPGTSKGQYFLKPDFFEKTIF